MENHTPAWTLTELAAMLGGQAFGNPEFVVRSVVPAESDDADGIAFCETPKYLEKAHSRQVGALILPRSLTSDLKPYIQVDHPRLAFGMLLAMSKRELPIPFGIHPTAVVDPQAQIDPSASVGPYCVVERGAVISAGCRIHAFCYVGENCRIGNNTVLYPSCVLYQDVTVGKGCILHSGSVIGADGFGFMWDGQHQMKVPQVGKTRLGDDVEVGANSCIDRATAGETRVGTGTKLDNMVQVAHNVVVGDHSVIAAHTGIGGSTIIGTRATFGGHCAVADHVNIAENVTFGGSSQIPVDIDEPGVYFGAPAIPAGEGMRAYALRSKLPEMLSRIRALEKKIKELEGK